MFKNSILLVLCTGFFLSGCSNTKEIKQDESAACNSEANLATYKQFLEELDRGHSDIQKYITRSRYGAVLGDQCQTFTKGMTVTVLEEKEIKSKFSASLVEAPDKKTYWMFSQDLD
jgi:hypothetical protein